MLIVAIAWIYVVGMAAIAEALSPQGTVLGAVVTFVFYGMLPLAIVLYLLGTPGRKRARRQAEEAAQAVVTQESGAPAATASAEGTGLQPDGSGHAAGSAGRFAAAVAPERKEP
jgi:membrane protein implicated in regulation of membrane protease activity